MEVEEQAGDDRGRRGGGARDESAVPGGYRDGRFEDDEVVATLEDRLQGHADQDRRDDRDDAEPDPRQHARDGRIPSSDRHRDRYRRARLLHPPMVGPADAERTSPVRCAAGRRPCRRHCSPRSGAPVGARRARGTAMQLLAAGAPNRASLAWTADPPRPARWVRTHHVCGECTTPGKPLAVAWRNGFSGSSFLIVPTGGRSPDADSRAGVTQLAECLLSKQNVAGSIPASRSTSPSPQEPVQRASGNSNPAITGRWSDARAAVASAVGTRQSVSVAASDGSSIT